MKKGFTLVENLATLILALLIVGLIVLIVVNMMNRHKVAQIKVDIEKKVNLAMDELANDLEGATLVVGSSYLPGIIQVPDQRQPQSNSLYFTVTSSAYDPLSAQNFNFERNYRQIRYFLSEDKKNLYRQVLGLDEDGRVKESEPLLTQKIIALPSDITGEVRFTVRHPLFDSSKSYHETDNPYQMNLFEVKIEVEYKWGKHKITYSAINKIKLEMP